MGHVMCPVTLPLVVAGDGGGCLKLRALAGRSLSVFLSLSIQAVAYLPVEYSSGARNGDRYGKEAENVQRTWLCELFCFALLFFRSAPQNFPPKKILSRRNIANIFDLCPLLSLFGHAGTKAVAISTTSTQRRLRRGLRWWAVWSRGLLLQPLAASCF